MEGYKCQVNINVRASLTSSVANAFQQARNRPARALSPAEQLQSAARALSPVRFFLRPGARDEEKSQSFSSLGDNTNASYSYEAEEAFVKAAAQVRKKPRVPKDELAYRPEDSGEESEVGGEGIHLDARENRGKRGERGEGYLGMGVAFQRGKSKRRNGDSTIDYTGVENDSDEDGPEVGEGSYQHRGYTPSINVQDVERTRSPTPMRLLRALSPRKSPYPSHTPLPGPSARRRPSRIRSMVTSTLNTVLTSLLSFYNAIANGKWLRWLATGFAILIALRLLEPLLGSLLSAGEHSSAPPASFDEFAGRLTTLETSITKLDSRVGHSESEIVSLRKDLGSQIQAIERELVGVRTRLGDVEEGVKNAIDDGRLRAALESFLPSRMPVRYVHGGLEIDPAFWVDLKKTFAGHEDVDRAVREAVSKAGSGAGKGSMPDLVAFEERLAARFGREQRDTANKAWFIDTLERELVSLRTSFDEKLRLAKALNATPKTNAKSKSAPTDDLVPFLQDLIDAALLRYSKDTLARADHALHSAGARVIPSITSDTYTVRQPSTFGRWVLGRKPVEGHPPAMALHPERSVGSCWPFEGSAGQLGVLLANRAVIQAVSVEHAPGELVASVASAPKEIEVVSRRCCMY